MPSGCLWKPAETSDPKAIQQKQRPRMTTRLPASAISFLAMLLACGTPSPHDYAAEIEAWRTEREARLKADDGWLTLTGLFFLNEGDNSFGSSPQNDIELRVGPERAGIVTLQDGRVDVRAVEGQTPVGRWEKGRCGTTMALRGARSTDDHPWPPLAVLS